MGQLNFPQKVNPAPYFKIRNLLSNFLNTTFHSLHKRHSFIRGGVKLICGFIFNDLKYVTLAKKILIKKFGPLDFESEDIKFDYTNYYEKELGINLTRKFVSFKKLINPDKLSVIKLFTNSLEDKLSFDKKRTINIDPGYLDLAKLVLATTKDFSHRIYLNKGIFAEITLTYQNKTFNPHPLTYPDYATPKYIQIFNKIREDYFQLCQDHT